MAPTRESKRYEEVLEVFKGQEKPLAIKDAVELLGGRKMSVRTMQEYVALMVQSGELKKYVEEEGRFEEVSETVPFKVPLYAVEGTVKSDDVSVVVKAYMSRMKRAIEKSDVNPVEDLSAVVANLRSSAPELHEKAVEFRRSNPFLVGFVAGAFAAFLVVVAIF